VHEHASARLPRLIDELESCVEVGFNVLIWFVEQGQHFIGKVLRETRRNVARRRQDVCDLGFSKALLIVSRTNASLK